MTTRTEHIAGLTVGTVESVAPDRILAALVIDAPQSTTLNAGLPTPFPRLNSYVLIPNELGALVGLISWIGNERSRPPRKRGAAAADLVDLPNAVRRLAITPLGTLLARGQQEAEAFDLERGVAAFPSVGDLVRLPTAAEFDALLRATKANSRVEIGTPLVTPRARVTVDPDKVFGRHLAVLGNTGSGKSCSVAGLIRWSLDAARKEREARPNARFIVLDPNGEYSKAFADLEGSVKVFQAVPDGTARSLRVPAWMWNSHEWSGFSLAGQRAQRPVLQQALRDMRAGRPTDHGASSRLARELRGYRTLLRASFAAGPPGYATMPGNKNCGQYLDGIVSALEVHHAEIEGDACDACGDLKELARDTAEARRERPPFWGAFTGSEISDVVEALDEAIAAMPSPSELSLGDEDAPIPFSVDELPDHLDHLVTTPGFEDSARWIGSLTMRVSSLLRDGRLSPIISPDENVELDKWLDEMIGDDDAENGQISIVDLSLVPSDVVEIVVASIGRLVFEALQRHRRTTGEVLPTVLVLEEAHMFIRRFLERDADSASAALLCRTSFERIAREGRKFGLGLVVSSQRPSELSETVLSQCNTFLLHRVVNERDQALISALVPDSFGGLLAELPILPARHAILMGWATAVPVMLKMHELAEEHRPRSADPRFWDVWTGDLEAPIDWGAVSDDWVKAVDPDEPSTT